MLLSQPLMVFQEGKDAAMANGGKPIFCFQSVEIKEISFK
jgi:hypothetical protein